MTLIGRRVEQAKLLLSTTNWSLPTIAHTAGCVQESHLALHFKRLSNLTLRNYCSLRKNLLLWRKNLGEGLAPFVLEYEQKRYFTYRWKQL